MVENAVFWLNTLLVDSGMSCTTSLWALMTGTTINFRKNAAEYNLAHTAEAHEKTFPPQIHAVTKQKPAIHPRTEQETSKGYYWLL